MKKDIIFSHIPQWHNTTVNALIVNWRQPYLLLNNYSNMADAEKKRKRAEKYLKEHPNGTCLIARDNPHNRKLFPDGPFGKTDKS